MYVRAANRVCLGLGGGIVSKSLYLATCITIGILLPVGYQHDLYLTQLEFLHDEPHISNTITAVM